MAKQIFFDDFTGDSFNASIWSPTWGKYDPNKGTQMRFSDKNISVAAGILKLTGTVAEGADAAKAPFLSGMVSTRKPDKGEVLFEAKGQFILSVRAQMPYAFSSWPGIWMTGTKGDWPACGEIDVIEAKGWQSDDYQMSTHTPRASDPTGTKSQQFAKTFKKSGSAGKINIKDFFHTYSVVKLNEFVHFYCDGRIIHTVRYSDMDDPTPFTNPENGWVIRLSHIIGGQFLDSGGTEEGHDKYVDATKFKEQYPSSMLVDYVRVISLDEPGTVDVLSDGVDLASKYAYIAPQPPVVVPPVVVPPAPQPQPEPPVVVPPTPQPPVVVPPTPTPEPTPAPRPRGKNDWVREEEALVFIML